MTTDKFSELVEIEIQKARSKHVNIRCEHEGYGVILEELDEFWDEVKAQHFNKEKALKELIQVAAMARRTAEDLQLL